MKTIGKFMMLGTATIAAAVALPAAAYACGEPPPAAFHTPSGNILCWMTPYTSSCQVVDHSYSVQGQSAGCLSPDSPHSFSLNEGAAATPEELLAFCRERLAHYKCPDSIEFGPLPKTSTGKTQKFVLRQREWADQDTQVGGV